MSEWKYDIVMQTQLGERFGTIWAEAKDNRLMGMLSIFGHCEPFCGVIDKDGNCEIKGKIITLMRTIEYAAYGIMNFQTVNLIVHGERNVLKLNGVACVAKKELIQ
ncbi:MAG: hypothetical protein ACI4Q8_01295 [Ruminococcus sp.]